ncbi:hypothetical protein [Streptomyces sp. NBC_01803]|uniref:hypothetical protein n=1 Tax=Streptomyces sp. NBC_01803 TaxID=2975946 RepID=UPI002DD8302B|nr:hypothetical protein [Streptomyces sp. NBC_01803]WSA44557.1 hypothetical protein OIE51_10270 [Streptomyces sp. NBC_01803]
MTVRELGVPEGGYDFPAQSDIPAREPLGGLRQHELCQEHTERPDGLPQPVRIYVGEVVHLNAQAALGLLQPLIGIQKLVAHDFGLEQQLNVVTDLGDVRLGTDRERFPHGRALVSRASPGPQPAAYRQGIGGQRSAAPRHRTAPRASVVEAVARKPIGSARRLARGGSRWAGWVSV